MGWFIWEANMTTGDTLHKAICISAGILVISMAPAWAGCRSAAGSPEWPGIARAMASAQLCEQLPMGPNHTGSFKVLSADVCSNGNGLSSIRATALVTCETGPDALFQTPSIESEVVATASVDVGACRITDADIEIAGELGSLLSGFSDTRGLARDWAQSQLSRLCRLR
jgi:hypothetical protein